MSTGRMLQIAQTAGARLIGSDRMWHYTEGIENWAPIWPHHGIRIMPGAVIAVARRDRQAGCRCRCSPASTRSARSPTSARSGPRPHLVRAHPARSFEREFALSGSEQNPDIASKSISGGAARARLGAGIPTPIEAFMRQGRRTSPSTPICARLVSKMNTITGGEPELPFEQVEREVTRTRPRDGQPPTPRTRR